MADVLRKVCAVAGSDGDTPSTYGMEDALLALHGIDNMVKVVHSMEEVGIQEGEVNHPGSRQNAVASKSGVGDERRMWELRPVVGNWDLRSQEVALEEGSLLRKRVSVHGQTLCQGQHTPICMVWGR